MDNGKNVRYSSEGRAGLNPGHERFRTLINQLAAMIKTKKGKHFQLHFMADVTRPRDETTSIMGYKRKFLKSSSR
ncbi:hypothetical protein BgiBS90_030724 [Biomphalaria glabrata]|nr:hypothetical protein BgiBS90_030724 [Biomphalaria glabrata]